MPIQKAKFSIGDIVKHKHFDFRGVIYDVDFEFNNSESGISLFQKMLDQEKTNHFIIYLLKMTKSLMKPMYQNKIS